MATIINSGDASSGWSVTPDSSGALTIQTGPVGSKVNALTLDAAGNTKIATSMQFSDGTAISSASQLSMRNRVINGAMNIDQRNSGAAVTNPNGATLDRWDTQNNTATGTLTVQQSTMTGFGKSLRATATVAITALTTTLRVRPCLQIIESQNCFDLNAKTVTFSFKAETNWAGNLAVAFLNSLSTRSYVTNVAVVSGINTCAVTLALEATTVTTNDTGGGFIFDIGFCNQADLQTATTGSWITGNFHTSTTSTQWCTTAGNFVNITQIQFEQGAVATPFEQRPIGVELALCQRYYEKSYSQGDNPGTVTQAGEMQSTATTPWILANGSCRFKVDKRAIPTISIFAPQSGAVATVSEYDSGGVFVANLSSITIGAGTGGFAAEVYGTATVGDNIYWHFTANSEYY